MAKFDIDRLKAIDIMEVLEALGARPVRGNSQLMHCFNADAHANGDAHPSLSIRRSNTCKCFACGSVSGDTIAVATFAHDGDFKAACSWLHETWGIPYLAEAPGEPGPRPGRTGTPPAARAARPQKRIEYMEFDLSRERARVRVADYLPMLDRLTKAQRQRLAYTYVYRASLMTDQSPKIAYYRSRGIESPWEEVCGWVGWEDSRRILSEMSRWWHPEELEEFGIGRIWGAGGGKPWSFYGDSIVVPSFSHYADTIDGVMLRLIGSNRKRKEHLLWKMVEGAAHPLPFGLTTEMLRGAQEIWITEGHIDALSLNQVTGKAFVAFPGTNGWAPEILGAFRNKDVVCAFDMDESGDTAFERLVPYLRAAGARTFRRMIWNPEKGGDINELLVNGQLKDVYHEFLAAKQRRVAA